jgi:hypothetical protein
MKEGKTIHFHYNNEVKTGLILKIYTQIGGENHREVMVVIRINEESGLFEQGTINIKHSDLHLI